MARHARKQREIEELAQRLKTLLAEDFDDTDEQYKTFDELETNAIAVGDEISRLLLEKSAAERGQKISAQKPDCCCPDCQRECSFQEPEPRLLQTCRGEVTWLEGNYFCRHCRRSFFPYKQPLGNPSS